MRKEGLYLLICMIVFGVFVSGGVVADDLSDCVNKCKVNLETEEERSLCIGECKTLEGVEDGETDGLFCLV